MKIKPKHNYIQMQPSKFQTYIKKKVTHLTHPSKTKPKANNNQQVYLKQGKGKQIHLRNKSFKMNIKQGKVISKKQFSMQPSYNNSLQNSLIQKNIQLYCNQTIYQESPKLFGNKQHSLPTIHRNQKTIPNKKLKEQQKTTKVKNQKEISVALFSFDKYLQQVSIEN